MKRRTRNYLQRQNALNEMLHFTNIKDLLLAGFQASKSLVVKKDILNMVIALDSRPMQYAQAS